MPWAWYSPVPDLWIRCAAITVNKLTGRAKVETWLGDVIENLRVRRVGEALVAYE